MAGAPRSPRLGPSEIKERTSAPGTNPSDRDVLRDQTQFNSDQQRQSPEPPPTPRLSSMEWTGSPPSRAFDTSRHKGPDSPTLPGEDPSVWLQRNQERLTTPPPLDLNEPGRAASKTSHRAKAPRKARATDNAGISKLDSDFLDAVYRLMGPEERDRIYQAMQDQKNS